MSDDIRALEAKATGGPWEWWRNPDALGEDGVHATALAKRNEGGCIVDAVTVCRGMTGPNREANARFIAAARTAVPALLAERDGLARERDEARANGERFRQSMYALEKRVLDLRAENERMRALLERAKPWVEHGLPPDRGHSCGPESACDGECVDLARGCALLLDIRAALNPADKEPT